MHDPLPTPVRKRQLSRDAARRMHGMLRISEIAMTQGIDLSFAPIADVSAQIRDLQLSPVSLADHCLRRIDALNPRLNAFITVTAELAREQARRAEGEIRSGRWRGPLHGVPV